MKYEYRKKNIRCRRFELYLNYYSIRLFESQLGQAALVLDTAPPGEIRHGFGFMSRLVISVIKLSTKLSKTMMVGAYLSYDIKLLARDVGRVPTGLTLSGSSESH